MQHGDDDNLQPQLSLLPCGLFWSRCGGGGRKLKIWPIGDVSAARWFGLSSWPSRRRLVPRFVEQIGAMQWKFEVVKEVTYEILVVFIMK